MISVASSLLWIWVFITLGLRTFFLSRLFYFVFRRLKIPAFINAWMTFALTLLLIVIMSLNYQPEQFISKMIIEIVPLFVILLIDIYISQTVKCPYCAKRIRIKAKICKKCSSNLST